MFNSTSDKELVVINHFRHSEILTLMTLGESEEVTVHLLLSNQSDEKLQKQPSV